MMNMLGNIAEDLFFKIRSRFAGLKLGESSGEITVDPKAATFFDFNYKEGEKDIGHVSISLAEEGSMKVYFSSGIAEGMDTSQQKNWYNFLKEMRGFAKRRLLNFDVRDITKDSLDKRDYDFLRKHAMQDIDKPVAEPVEENIMNESTLYGTKTQSFQKLNDTKMIIKHSKRLTDDQVENPSARTRNISSLFIENSEGERFKYPHRHLAGARAMQRHVANGGNPYDQVGSSITQMSEEIKQLKQFQNYVSRNDLVSESNSDIVEKGNEQLNSLREQVKRLSKQRNYEAYVENFEADQEIELPETVRQELKNKFTVVSFKEEMENVFPVLYRLMKENNSLDYDDIMQKTSAGAEQATLENSKETVSNTLEDFEKWAMSLGEESAITSRDAEEKQSALRELNRLMDEHFPAGVDGTNAIESLEGVIDDPALFNQIRQVAKENPDQCVRPMVKDWLEDNAPEVVDDIDFGDMQEEGNKFTGAMTKAKKLGKDEFEVDGETFKVEEVADFVMSFYDRERGTFPKGPTAVEQQVAKKFGETAGTAASRMIERMAPAQDVEIDEEDIESESTSEFNTLKKLAGL